jgi:hypothetical protein
LGWHRYFRFAIVSATARWFADRNSTKAILLSRSLDKAAANRRRLNIATTR